MVKDRVTIKVALSYLKVCTLTKKQEGANIMSEHRVAVYGTLKHGHGNHRLLSSNTLVGTAWLKGWTMYDLGAFPAVMPSEDPTDDIWCEVYEGLTDAEFERLDGLEGYPHLYNRKQVSVCGHEDVWVYYMDNSTNRYGVVDRPKVTNGIWVDTYKYNSSFYN